MIPISLSNFVYYLFSTQNFFVSHNNNKNKNQKIKKNQPFSFLVDNYDYNYNDYDYNNYDYDYNNYDYDYCIRQNNDVMTTTTTKNIKYVEDIKPSTKRYRSRTQSHPSPLSVFVVVFFVVVITSLVILVYIKVGSFGTTTTNATMNATTKTATTDTSMVTMIRGIRQMIYPPSSPYAID